MYKLNRIPGSVAHQHMFLLVRFFQRQELTSRLVEARCRLATLRLSRSAASDRKVYALGVVLSAVFRSRSVQRNDLVADDIVASGQVGRDGDGPGIVRGDQVVGSKSAGVRAGNPTLLVELCPFEVGRGSGATVAVTCSNIVDDGP